MSGPGLNSLATIIKRLEACTSRLEDLAVAQASGTLFKQGDKAPSAVVSSSVPPPPPPPPPPAVQAPPAAMEVPRSVTAFDENVIDARLKPFVELTKSFSAPLVIEQVGKVESAFSNLRTIIFTAANCTKPDAGSFGGLLDPLRNDVNYIASMPEKNRKERQWYNHLEAIANGCPSLGWVEVEPKPGPYIASMKESAEFYTNKIIKEFKEKDPKQVEWSRGWLSLIEEMRKYVMEYHTTGLTWNPKGVPLSEFSSSRQPTASAGAPPPPPPPPPAAMPPPPASGGGVAAVFAEINRGEEVTKGLRKVDKSEMTHKNPALRASSVVPATASSSAAAKKPVKPSKPAALSGKKPAKFALEGTKWLIENHDNEPALIVDQTEISHTVNIFGCKNTTIQVKGKINAVTLVNSVKTSVLVESVISSVSVTNSQSINLQILGSAPTIQLDQTDSAQLYLSKECLGVEITTAKCASINVSLPVEGEEEGVFVEKAIPEMLRTTIQDGKLVTTIVEHAG